MLHTLWQDLRHAARALLRTPLHTLIAVGSLAFGLGATITVFSIVDALQFRPLPYDHASQLVDVYEFHPDPDVLCTGCGVGTSYPNYIDWRESAASFDAMAAYNEEPMVLGLREGAEQRTGARVSANLFATLGVQPLHGRTFNDVEEKDAAAHVAVIGERLWRTRFDSAPPGFELRINGVPHTVIGVMRDNFAFPDFSELWLPLASAANDARDARSIGVVARLAADRKLEAAAAEMDGIGQQLEKEYSEANAGWRTRVVSLRADLADDYIQGFALMLAAVTFVLLIACANLASLMLARGASRRRELAVRASLGAGRFALARHVLTESILLAIVGGGAGLLLASFAMDAFIAWQPAGGLPRWVVLTIDPRIVVFALLLALTTGFVFGMLPAMQAARVDPNTFLKEGAYGSPGVSRTRLRTVLVVAQVACALMLVLGAGIMVRTFDRLVAWEPGYDIEGLTGGSVNFAGERYDSDDERRLAVTNMLDELRTQLATQHVAISGMYVLNWPGTPRVTVAVEGRPAEDVEDAVSHISTITPAYFETLRIPLVQGRAFTAQDRAGSAPVAIVNETAARTLWPDRPSIGQQIRIGAETITIVGVAPDLQRSPYGRGAGPLMFRPFDQLASAQPAGPLALHIRAPAGAQNLQPTVRAAVARLDPDIIVNDVMPVATALRQWVAPVGVITALVSALGSFALLLAGIGVYGVVAFTVAQRRRELSIRAALGASARDLVRMVVAHGARLVGIGVLVGALPAYALARVIPSMMTGAAPADPLLFAVAALLFLLLAIVASFGPARTAARVNPSETLRVE